MNFLTPFSLPTLNISDQNPIVASQLTSAYVEPTLTPRKKKLVAKLNRQTFLAMSRLKKLAAVRSRCRRLEKKNAEMSGIIKDLQSKHLINQESADLLSSMTQGTLKLNKSKFTPEVRKFALHLHFISPHAYNFVRNSFNTCLPHTQCGLSFDEMAIRQSVEWNIKNYFGFVDYGYHQEGDVLPVAKKALVFRLTCLNGSWKLPVGYFLVQGTTSEQKASLVKTCIDLICECGIDIVSVTFDGSPAIFSMMKLDSPIVNPVFSHNSKKVVAFPDPSHMLKLVRNTLGDKICLTNAEGGIISWNFVKLLVDIQEEKGFHLANKVRHAHVNYKKQIMKVRLASQLFSESVAEALEFCAQDLRLEQFENSEATVDFIRKLKSLFDIMNSRNLNAYGYKNH